MSLLSDIAPERGFEKGAAAELLLLYGKSRKRLNTELQTADKTGGAATRFTPCPAATADCACESVPGAYLPSS